MQLYLLAADILGPRPRVVTRRASTGPKTYQELLPALDDFANALIEIEAWTSSPSEDLSDADDAPTPSLLYFCVPPNDLLLGRWDTVADRLFKIRHCMNIAGVERQLPLFEPPIDPALLVRAAAAGLDIGSVLADLSAPLPHHRFMTMLQKALECKLQPIVVVNRRSVVWPLRRSNSSRKSTTMPT